MTTIRGGQTGHSIVRGTPHQHDRDPAFAISNECALQTNPTEFGEVPACSSRVGKEEVKWEKINMGRD